MAGEPLQLWGPDPILPVGEPIVLDITFEVESKKNPKMIWLKKLRYLLDHITEKSNSEEGFELSLTRAQMSFLLGSPVYILFYLYPLFLYWLPFLHSSRELPAAVGATVSLTISEEHILFPQLIKE